MVVNVVESLMTNARFGLVPVQVDAVRTSGINDTFVSPRFRDTEACKTILSDPSPYAHTAGPPSVLIKFRYGPNTTAQR